MLDTTLGTDEQLFVTDSEEVSDEQDTDSEEVSEETSDDEQEQGPDLFRVNEAPEDKAAASATKQIEAMQRKINAGDIQSADDLPKAQRWMAKVLTFPEAEPEVSLSDLKDEVKREIKSDAQFDLLKDSVAEYATDEQLKEINRLYNAWTAKGLNRFDALEQSSKDAKVDFKGVQSRKLSMRLPSTFSRPSKPSIEAMESSRDKFTVQERVAELRRRANS